MTTQAMPAHTYHPYTMRRALWEGGETANQAETHPMVPGSHPLLEILFFES